MTVRHTTSRTAFLRRRGNVWYAAVPVPRSLRHHFGDVRLVKSLKTDSLAEAQEARWPVIAELKARISAAKRAAAGLPPNLLDEAKRLRSALLSAPDDETLALAVSTRLEALAARHGDALAIEVAHVAQGAKTLEEAAVPWIAASDKESTRAQRRSVVDVLAATMKRRTSEILVERIGKAEVLSVVEAWEGEGLASSTIGNRVAVLSALWKLLASRGVVKVNPFHGVKPMKRSRGSRAEKRAFTAVEAAKVIALREEEPTSLRSCTMWALGFLTGARANELLTARDLEETKGATWFTVTPENAKTKSSARRVCVTGNDARKLLRAWVGMEKLDRASMSGGVRRFLDARGLGEDVDYHSTRRTFINLAERAGADPLGVMRFTGHQPSGMSFSLYSTSGSDAALEGVSKTVTATYGKPFAKVLTALAAAAK